MYLDQPRPFEEARQKLNQRVPVAIDLTAAQWGDVPLDIRERAFWSARIMDARFVQSMKSRLDDHMNQATQTETNAAGEERLSFKVSGREDFVREMLATGKELGLGNLLAPAAEQGMPAKALMEGVGPTRLRLVFDTAMRSARGYGWWKEGNKQEILDAYPAAQFIRLHAVAVPRPLHEAHEGEIHLKSDLAFWMDMNRREIGGFGVPWEPFGYNSGMGTKDVPRSVCVQMGLIKPGERISNPELGFNEAVEASVSNLSPEILDKLRAALGPNVVQEGDKLQLVPAAKVPAISPAPKTLSPERQIDDVMDRMATLSATILGKPATFDGRTWSYEADAGIEQTLNDLTRIGRFRGEFIDDTARNVLAFMKFDPLATIDSFTRYMPQISNDPNIRQ